MLLGFSCSITTPATDVSRAWSSPIARTACWGSRGAASGLAVPRWMPKALLLKYMTVRASAGYLRGVPATRNGTRASPILKPRILALARGYPLPHRPFAPFPNLSQHSTPHTRSPTGCPCRPVASTPARSSTASTSSAGGTTAMGSLATTAPTTRALGPRGANIRCQNLVPSS